MELPVQLAGHGIKALGKLFKFITAVDLNLAGEILVPDPFGALPENSQRGQGSPDEKKGKKKDAPQGENDDEGKRSFKLQGSTQHIGTGAAE